MIKKYRQNTIVIYLIIIPLFAFLVLNNLNTITQENLIHTLTIGFVTILVLLVSTWQSYLEINNYTLKQRSWFFFRKELLVSELENLQYDQKYEFFFMHNGYIILKKKDSDEVVMAINPRSYRTGVISEFLADLQKLNQSVRFDKEVSEIQNGKVLE